jgi:thiol-disulfide isomerase/thioredoxin
VAHLKVLNYCFVFVFAAKPNNTKTNMSSTTTTTPLHDLLGPTLQDRDGHEVQTSTLAPLVGIYFGAGWCGPCRLALPKLVRAVDTVHAGGHALDIVYLSNDNNAAEFADYFSNMPWLAVPFADMERVARLTERFELKNIPSLVLVDQQGQIQTVHGLHALLHAPEQYPWHGYAPPASDSLAPNAWQFAAIVCLLAWWAVSGAAIL